MAINKCPAKILFIRSILSTFDTACRFTSLHLSNKKNSRNNERQATKQQKYVGYFAITALGTYVHRQLLCTYAGWYVRTTTTTMSTDISRFSFMVNRISFRLQTLCFWKIRYIFVCRCAELSFTATSKHTVSKCVRAVGSDALSLCYQRKCQPSPFDIQIFLAFNRLEHLLLWSCSRQTKPNGNF